MTREDAVEQAHRWMAMLPGKFHPIIDGSAAQRQRDIAMLHGVALLLEDEGMPVKRGFYYGTSDRCPLGKVDFSVNVLDVDGLVIDAFGNEGKNVILQAACRRLMKREIHPEAIESTELIDQVDNLAIFALKKATEVKVWIAHHLLETQVPPCPRTRNGARL